MVGGCKAAGRGHTVTEKDDRFVSGRLKSLWGWAATALSAEGREEEDALSWSWIRDPEPKGDLSSFSEQV